VVLLWAGWHALFVGASSTDHHYVRDVDGAHDMGGMHGFGPICVEDDEPTFHEPWEGRTFALMIVTGAKRLRHGTIRAHIEAMPPERYLPAGYFERWAFAVERALVEGGSLTTPEIDDRAASGQPGPATADPAFTAWLVGALSRPNDRWPPAPSARFAVGDDVTVKRMAPVAHHRCPRYVRGVTGAVERLCGGWPRPDGSDEPEALYTVRFERRALWGDDAEPGPVYLDLWEGYLS
jgi:nitrile hydratase